MSTKPHPHSGRTALVTGSTSGIGLGIAKALAAAGANVVVNGIGKPDEIEKALAAVRGVATGEVTFADADMRVPGAIAEMCAEAVKRFDGIDILVNNAGIQYVAPVEEFPAAKWDEILAINLSSVFHTVRAAIPSMKDKGWGRIVNIASAHALVASPYKVAYIAAKHGMAGVTRTVALEVAQDGITVNAIAPGYVETPLVTGQIAATAKARGISEDEVVSEVMQSAQPTGRFVAIEEVAALTLHLCSDTAASITGAVLSIDGGWSAR